jgi:hypothetical protein
VSAATTATPRQKATIGVLVVVLITVLWFQFVWRGHHESSAGAVVDDSAAAAVIDDSAGPSAADPSAPAAADVTTTTLPVVPVDHVAELRLVHESVTAAGLRLVGYVPATDDTAQVQLEGSYDGLVAFLADLRARAPHATITSLAVEPGTSTLSITFTVEWAA